MPGVRVPLRPWVSAGTLKLARGVRMINASEVKTLKDRQRQIRTLAAAMLAVAASGVVTPLAAQQRRGPTATTPRFVVVNFRSADKAAGVAAASALRERLQKDNDIRK